MYFFKNGQFDVVPPIQFYRRLLMLSFRALRRENVNGMMRLINHEKKTTSPARKQAQDTP